MMMNHVHTGNAKDMTHVAHKGIGKHVIVTLGERGLLWLSSDAQSMGWDGKARAGECDIIELDDHTYAR